MVTRYKDKIPLGGVPASPTCHRFSAITVRFKPFSVLTSNVKKPVDFDSIVSLGDDGE